MNNEYMSGLPEPILDWFEEIGIDPENDYDASNSLRSYYNINSTNEAVVNLKMPVFYDDEPIEKVYINKNEFIDCFFPKIWKQLKPEHKMLATYYLFEHLVDSNSEVKKLSPSLVFAPSENSASTMPNNSVHISIDLFLKRNKGSMEILNMLSHEVHHLRQNIYLDDIINKIHHSNKIGKVLTREDIGEYEFSMINANDGNRISEINANIAEYDENFETLKKNIKNLQYKNSNKKIYIQDEKYLDYLKEICEDDGWQGLLHLFYLLSPGEISSYNKGGNFVKSVRKYFDKHFEPIKYTNDFGEFHNSKQEIEDTIEILKSSGFYFHQDALQELEKLMKIITSKTVKVDDARLLENDYFPSEFFFKSANWVCMKHLLNIYKNKMVKTHIDQNIVDQIERKKLDAINKNIEDLFEF